MKMNKIKLLVIVIFLVTISQIVAQDYVFFTDSASDLYLEPSWGYFNSPSTLVLAGGEINKFPVSAVNKFAGLNSLKLQWKSQTGGNWEIAVAEDGWIKHDVTKKDSIIFYVYSDSDVPKSEFPLIYIEDLSNQKTERFPISDFNNDIIQKNWQRISIPLQIFKDNPASANLTEIKTIFFGQNLASGIEHTWFIDEISMISASAISDTIAPITPQNITAKGFDKHIEFEWNLNSESDLRGYNIYQLIEDEYKMVGFAEPSDSQYFHFTNISGVTNQYKISAIDESLNESDLSEVISASTFAMTDDEFLTMLQEYTFKYFWDYGHPISGLSRERDGSNNTVTSGGSGFGIMAIIVGIERGFITREEGANRIKKISDFLLNKADKFHGAFSHWLNGENGDVIPFSQYDNGGDLVETSFLIQGLLAARQYFNEDNETENFIKSTITTIWENVEWDWYRKTETETALFWHWSPNYNWQMNFRLQGPNEVMIAYLLAIASPTHSVPASLYHTGWAGSPYYLNGDSFYNYKLDVGWDFGGPLFFAHYSFLGFDPRDKKDAYTNYFVNNKNHTLINRAYCADNPKNYAGYSENIWGLTASDDPFGYSAHEPTYSRDNGTITPTAALSSFPYTPNESMAAFRSLYEKYGEKIWKKYGFTDSFNPQQNWYAESYLAIDQGPIIVMVENYRSGLLWNLFMSNPEIAPMLTAIGFVADPTDVANNEQKPTKFELFNNYPNPFNPSTVIKYSLPQASKVSLKVYDVLGRLVKVLINDEHKSAGNFEVEFRSSSTDQEISSGVYLYQLITDYNISTKKMMLIK